MAFEEYFVGKRERLSWVDETSYGSGGDMATDGEIIGLNARIEPTLNQSWQDILSAGDDDRTIQNRVVGPLDLRFTLVFTPVNWKFLKYLGYSVADAGSGPYTHTFSLSNSIQSFKLEWARRHTTPSVKTLTGCVALNGTISFSKPSGGESSIIVRLNCIAQNVSEGSTVTALSSISDTPFQYRHTKLTLDNTEIIALNNGEITIDNGINPDDSRYCNATLDRLIGEPIPKTHKITGRFNINIKNNTLFTLWDSADVISNCSLDFIQSDANKLEGAFQDFRIGTIGTPTNLDGVTNTNLVWSARKFSSLIATDSNSSY